MFKAGKQDFRDGVFVTKEKYASAHGDYKTGFQRQFNAAMKKHGLVKIADLRLNEGRLQRRVVKQK
jgi:hypothetical protein